MPTRRGWAAFAAGFFLWIAARFLGSPDLHMVAVGIIATPFLGTLFVQWNRVRLDLHRHISSIRVFPGTRVVITLKVTNRGATTAPFLLMEDALPTTLGKPARLVVTGIPSRNEQSVSYSVVPRHRGRVKIGPLAVFITDPLGLARVRLQAAPEKEVVVYPEVEDIEPWRLGMQGAGSGDSRVRQLWRSAAEFYTMREYVTGDDLRRLHWPSVARTGQLMIRQDESTRRSLSALFFDNRNSSLGASGSPAFERGVSAAATMGRLLVRAGYAVRFASIDTPPTVVTETGLLEMLSDVGSVRARTIREALGRLRASAQPESSLVLVSSPLPAPEIGVLSQIGTGFGRKLAVIIYPVKPSTIPPPAAAELEGRAKHARSSLARAGWDVIILQPDGRLADAWHVTASPRGLRVPVSSSS
jgi:uncharacterized protein (DUF58 family)